MSKQTESMDDFFDNQETPERKVKVHDAGDDSKCVSCEG